MYLSLVLSLVQSSEKCRPLESFIYSLDDLQYTEALSLRLRYTLGIYKIRHRVARDENEEVRRFKL